MDVTVKTECGTPDTTGSFRCQDKWRSFPMMDLQPEILQYIGLFLSMKEIIWLSRTCKKVKESLSIQEVDFPLKSPAPEYFLRLSTPPDDPSIHSLCFYITIPENSRDWDLRSLAIGSVFVVAHSLEATDLRMEKGRLVNFELGFQHDEFKIALAFRVTKYEKYCLYLVGGLAQRTPRFLINCIDPPSSCVQAKWIKLGEVTRKQPKS